MGNKHLKKIISSIQKSKANKLRKNSISVLWYLFLVIFTMFAVSRSISSNNSISSEYVLGEKQSKVENDTPKLFTKDGIEALTEKIGQGIKESINIKEDSTPYIGKLYFKGNKFLKGACSENIYIELLNKNAYYIGEIKNNLPNGSGKIYYTYEGYKFPYYKGKFKNGKCDGNGILFKKNSNQVLCLGKFKDDIYQENVNINNALRNNAFQQANIIEQNESNQPSINTEEEQGAPMEVKWDKISASSELNSQGVLFKAGNVDDHDSSTAWAEGTNGDGIGEWIKLEKNTPFIIDGIGFENGYQKSDYSYYSNNRPKKVRVEFSDGRSVTQELPDRGCGGSEIYLGNEVITQYIKITILEVYKGSKYQDTCISEISAYN